MRKIVIVHVYRGEKYYVAEGVDLPIVTQAEGLDKLVENVREAITLYKCIKINAIYFLVLNEKFNIFSILSPYR
ncbi:MAG: hypothetical protein J7K23_04345 [Thermoproteales archaeon]|nr:hypothetical protein [Thermoproteales archaeon]